VNEHNDPHKSLASSVFRGAAWLFSSYGLSKLNRMIIMLTIVALLSPEAYGVVSLCSVIIFVGEITTELGIWQAVVHNRDPDERFLNTAFTANVLGGCVIVVGLLLGAPLIAQFYHQPELTNVLRVMAPGLLAEAMFFVPDGWLRKQLKFRIRSVAEVGSSFVAVVTTITLLFLEVGVMSFAVGYLVEKIFRCTSILIIARWRPTFQLYWSSLREIASYAKFISSAEVAKLVSSNVDFLIVARVLGAGPLGLYTLGFNLANYPVTNFAIILSRIAFPTFAILQEDPDYCRRAYLRIVQIVAGLVIPLLVMLAILAAPLIVGCLGERWQSAVFPTQVLVIAGISRAISIPGSDLLRASGFPNLPLKINVAETLALIGALVALASWGIEAVALTVTVVLSLSSWATTLVTCRVFGIGLLELGQSILPGLGLAASGAAAVYCLQVLDLSSLPSSLELALLIASASAGMVICLTTVLRSFLHEILALGTSRSLKRQRFDG
jgi:O-antigen/teichoic acid export membrane protein